MFKRGARNTSFWFYEVAQVAPRFEDLQHPHMTPAPPIQNTIMLPMLALYLLAFLGTAQAAGECANVTLTFCDNVRWQVNEEKRARADNIESMIQMSYYNQPGKWSCKNEFKDLQCRVMFPQCTDVGGVGANKAPCRSKCTDFLSRCPGADIGCDDLSNDPKQCYEYTYESPLSTVGTNADMRGWPSILIALVVLGGMVGLAFVAGKMKKNRDPQGLRTSHTEFSNL